MPLLSKTVPSQLEAESGDQEVAHWLEETQEQVFGEDTPPRAHDDRGGSSGKRSMRGAEVDAQSFLGRQIGSYEITRFLARGGMGLVFVGRDTRLGRQVAIKALPSALIRDPESRARLVREAKILATVSHPGVATVYGMETTAEGELLIMELVEGRTLSDRLAREGALPVAEALDICAQIASAVEAAHRAGVIHRDLKPSNVMLTPNGKIKVLDFGLAREIRRTSGSDGPSLTSAHVLVGTPGYMSPEQARGAKLDERTDVFAIGAILFECLTGAEAFPGATVADVLVAILLQEPDWSALPGDVPEPVRSLLERCLSKDVEARPRDVGEVRSVLEQSRSLLEPSRPGKRRPQSGARPLSAARPFRSRLYAAAFFGAGAVTAAAATLALRPRPAPASAAVPAQETPVRRLSIAYPGGTPQRELMRLYVAISRDGRRVVFTAAKDAGPVMLWQRNLDELEARPLPDTEGARTPFLSPDGQWVAYLEDGTLKKRRLGGGSAFNLAAHPAFGGGAWGSDGVLSISPTWIGVARLPEHGGALQYVNQRAAESGEAAYLLPEVLPDNRALLYTVWNGKEDTRIDAFDVATGERHVVVESGSNGRLARSSRGLHLLWERKGTIYAARFDAERRRLDGPEHAVVDGVLTDAAEFVSRFAVSDEGTLVYIPGGVVHEEARLEWIGADGHPTHATEERQPFAEPHLSADGKKLSVIVRRRVYVAYVHDLEHGTSERISFDADVSSGAISPDGEQYIYGSHRDGGHGVWLKTLRDGVERRLGDPGAPFLHQFAWSADGSHVAFTRSDSARSAHHIWVLSLDGASSRERRLTDSSATEIFPTFSPNGKWIAYAEGDEDGHRIYVRSFPDGGVKRQITAQGGTEPLWSADGKTLYYRSGAEIRAVGVSAEDGKTTGGPRVVHAGRLGQLDGDLRSYAVGRDGRILVVAPAEDGPKVTQINAVLGWDRALP
ncbi:protein kinase domain-containing protein [Polyangium aurulentum]|uniref:protein kinase domain-containing protein n=1 Tax=Polyangium aurulentum TaxID=2567896 RepID=UPI0010AEE2AE|nr:protein kinase [Polyangium aurulentum]UQA58111.1 protein kinase [Polyangium aurulentum]